MGFFYGIVSTIDKVLLMFVLLSVIVFVWKFRHRLAYFLLGDTRLRLDRYDFFSFLCCCGFVERYFPTLLPGQVVAVKVTKIECRNLPSKDFFGGTYAFVQVELGNNPSLTTRVKSTTTDGACLFTSQLEMNVRQPGCGICPMLTSCMGDSLGEFIVKDQDMAIHDEIGRLRIRSSKLLKLARSRQSTGWTHLTQSVTREDVSESACINISFDLVSDDEEEMQSQEGMMMMEKLMMSANGGEVIERSQMPRMVDAPLDRVPTAASLEDEYCYYNSDHGTDYRSGRSTKRSEGEHTTPHYIRLGPVVDPPRAPSNSMLAGYHVSHGSRQPVASLPVSSPSHMQPRVVATTTTMRKSIGLPPGAVAGQRDIDRKDVVDSSGPPSISIYSGSSSSSSQTAPIQPSPTTHVVSAWGTTSPPLLHSSPSFAERDDNGTQLNLGSSPGIHDLATTHVDFGGHTPAAQHDTSSGGFLEFSAPHDDGTAERVLSARDQTRESTPILPPGLRGLAHPDEHMIYWRGKTFQSVELHTMAEPHMAADEHCERILQQQGDKKRGGTDDRVFCCVR